MSSLKSQIKIDMAKGLVEQTGSLAQGCLDELYRFDGEKRALSKAINALQPIYKRVDDLVDAGSLEGLSSLEVAAAIKKAITEVHQSLVSLSDYSEVMRTHSTGRLDAFKQTSEIIRRVAEVESQKLSAIAEAIENSVSEEPLPQVAIPAARPLGVRPPESQASKRKAEVRKKPTNRVLKSGGGPSKAP